MMLANASGIPVRVERPVARGADPHAPWVVARLVDAMAAIDRSRAAFYARLLAASVSGHGVEPWDDVADDLLADLDQQSPEGYAFGEHPDTGALGWWPEYAE